MRAVQVKKVLRVLDANFNRVKEALRVCEDTFRFVCDDKVLTKQCKDMRHQLTENIKQLGLKQLLNARSIESDVGKATHKLEVNRREIKDIVLANLQRAKESIRVLEEFSKLYQESTAIKFKNLRYKLYALEKKAATRF